MVSGWWNPRKRYELRRRLGAEGGREGAESVFLLCEEGGVGLQSRVTCGRDCPVRGTGCVLRFLYRTEATKLDIFLA